MAELCICGHERDKHWRNTSHCLARVSIIDSVHTTECNCTKYVSQETSVSYTIQLTQAGNARVLLRLGEVELVMTTNSLVELSLEGLRTANLARIQEALAKYANAHNIPLEELLQVIQDIERQRSSANVVVNRASST